VDRVRTTRHSQFRAGRRCAVAALAASAILSAARPGFGQCQYEVTAIIQGPNCQFTGPQPTIATGMNNHGHIVGYYWDCVEPTTVHRAFVWKPETGLVTLPTPSGVASAEATDINDAGFIIGGHRFPGVGWKGFVLDPKTQQFTYLEALYPDIGPVVTLSTANAINNKGIVAGSRVISEPGVSPTISNAVIWDTNTGEVIDLGVGAGPNSSALDINEAGHAVGWSGNDIGTANNRAILWMDGVGIDLGVLPGMVKSVARKLNNQGFVIGSSGPESGTGHAFLWHKDKMNPIPPPDGYDLVGVNDINDSGQIVGHMRLAGTSQSHRLLWQHEQYHNFVDLLVGSPPNFTVTVLGIAGNNGKIVGRAILNGTTVAAIFTPLDVPIADLNFDCKVDVYDLLELLLEWGQDGESKADLDSNGLVDVFDLLMLLANWG
jgi:probable HAF family extracellular repeat protein